MASQMGNGNKDRFQMSREDKDKLRDHRLFMINNVLPSETLLSYLLQKRVLSEDHYEEINAVLRKSRKIAKLLDILPRRGPEAFRHFIDGLKLDGQSNVADFLDPSFADQRNSQQPKRQPKQSNSPTTLQTVPGPRCQQTFLPKPFCESEEAGQLNLEVEEVDLADENIIRLINDTEDIKSIFREESQKDHTYRDCFLSFIISPGVRGHFYGTDGGKVSIEDDIVMPLCERCPSLLNKPKIFFILACQGEPPDIEVPSGKEGDTGQWYTDDIVQAMEYLKVVDTRRTALRLRAKRSHVLLAYSTLPGYSSNERPGLDSYFIRTIIKVFSAEACKEDVMTLLNKVQKMVSEYYEKQNVSHLTVTVNRPEKRIYLFPGYTK
ncbi:hypothetical protein LSH36_166g00061 [Paralvinella palmiformis]|uniref:Uncharacterized protein n=1 Tax=Paralvinella palmiformis TaxID=53620 RepID=A0AAD9JSP7_9ANNE|nr:hypothetical protein LSH36_166g00061 [Paralvinella palmiformis]